MPVISLYKRRGHRHKPAPLPIVGKVQPTSPSVPTVVPSLQSVLHMMKALGLRKVEIRPDDSVGLDFCHNS